MTLLDVNDTVSTKSESDRPERIGLFISVCGFYVVKHLLFRFSSKIQMLFFF